LPSSVIKKFLGCAASSWTPERRRAEILSIVTDSFPEANQIYRTSPVFWEKRAEGSGFTHPSGLAGSSETACRFAPAVDRERESATRRHPGRFSQKLPSVLPGYNIELDGIL
jgi:hypothetical protein